MMGHSHSLSGAVAGAAVGEFILHLSLPATVALAAFTAGMALTPDLDSCGSSQARCLGFLTRSLAWVIRGVSGGHRHLTHSATGIAAFTGLAWLACHLRGDVAGKAGLALLITIGISSALEATHVTDGHLADVLGIAAAAGVIWYGYGLALIPLAAALGTGRFQASGTTRAGRRCTRQISSISWSMASRAKSAVSSWTSLPSR